MAEKDKISQRADGGGLSGGSLVAKKAGLARYQDHYAVRDKPFKIETNYFTDEQRQEIEAEIGSGSITPKTFKSRTFFSDDKMRAAEEKGEEKRSSVDVESTTETESGEIRSTLRSKLLDTIGQVLSEVDGLLKQKTVFEEYEQESIARFQELSKGVIQKKEFTEADKSLKTLGEKFTGKISPLQSFVEELNRFKAFIEQNTSLILTYRDSYENSTGNNVTRFGINVATMTKEQSSHLASIYTTPAEKEGSIKSGKSGNSSKKSKQSDKDQVKMLHPLEVLILKDAINHLQDTKTVLVDIFARNDDNSIRQENDKPETHTVVLCKKNAGEIIVIDPSDPVFSKHLSSNNTRLFRDGEEYVTIVSPFKEKIYVPVKNNTGPEPDQFRDCTDIAIKLAFGLNKLDGDIVAENIDSDVIKEVTNNDKIDQDFFFDPKDTISRIKQASNDKVREDIGKLIKAIKRQIDTVNRYDGDTGEVRAQAISQFTYDHDQYELSISGLLEQHINNTELLKNLVTQHETSLIAEITPNTEG